MRNMLADGNSSATNRAEGAPVDGLSPDHILELGFGFRAAKVLLSAVELDLFTELAAGSLDRETLRRRLGLHQRGARDFFDALVALGMLRRRQGLYSNAPETDFYLDRNKPCYIGGILRLANAWIYPNWCALTEALRIGEPQRGIGDGEDLFDHLYSDPDTAVLFAEAMTGASLPCAWALARQFPWAEYKTFVDIGTAEGALPVGIACAYPHLKGGGFDLPEMQPTFEAYGGRRGPVDRVTFHSGDFFRDPLPSADVLILGQILHDWNLEAKRELLAKAHAVLPNQGALIVYDRMIDDGRRQNTAGLLMSLSMLVGTKGGFDYTIGDCLGWMREVGFTSLRYGHLSGPFSMVVGVK